MRTLLPTPVLFFCVVSLLSTAAEGELLREGAVAVLAGRPNSGKSSLFNALVGHERAIVTDIPGTTRDAIEVGVSLGGYPFRLVDTAGLRNPTDDVERMGMHLGQGLDELTVQVEARAELSPQSEAELTAELLGKLRAVIEIRPQVAILPPNTIPRPEFKANRIRDERREL